MHIQPEQLVIDETVDYASTAEAYDVHGNVVERADSVTLPGRAVRADVASLLRLPAYRTLQQRGSLIVLEGPRAGGGWMWRTYLGDQPQRVIRVARYADLREGDLIVGRLNSRPLPRFAEVISTPSPIDVDEHGPFVDVWDCPAHERFYRDCGQGARHGRWRRLRVAADVNLVVLHAS